MLRRTLAGLMLLLPLALMAAPASAQDPLELRIFEIQGSGPQSPYQDQKVRTTGVVTADFLDTETHGFFIQDEEGDGDVATSDGVWAYHPSSMDDIEVAVGQKLEIVGMVNEYFDLTEIVLEAVLLVGSADVPEPVLVEAPKDPASATVYLEAREGMLASLARSRVVGATNTYGDSYVVPADSGVERIMRGDQEGRRLGLMFPAGWRSLTHGDEIEGILGGLTYNYENHKVQVRGDAPLDVTSSGREAPAAPPQADGTLRLATYNLENLFDPVDDPGKNDGDWTPTQEQYERNLAVRARSIVDHLGPPDILGVQEVENLGVLEDLSERLASLTGGTYGSALIDGPDGRGIDVGFVYDKGRVRLLSAVPEQECTELTTEGLDVECELPGGGTGWVLYSRPPLVGRFETLDDGGRVSVIVNHFKSKRGGDAATTPLRSAMAKHNLELLDELKADEPDVPVVILGDLNDFEDAAPLQVFAASGKTRDLHEVVPEAEDYTFIFNGVSQNLDYILVEPDQKVHLFQPMHVNSDFGSVPEEEVTGETQRASDHEPLLADIVVTAVEPTGATIFMPIAHSRYDIDATPVPPIDTSTPGPTATWTPAVTPLVPTPSSPTATLTPDPNETWPPATGAPTDTPEATTEPTTPAVGPPRNPLRIDTVFYNGAINPSEPDEYVAFTNVTAAAVDLTGWQLISVRGDQVYDFPAGFAIEASQACRVYTNQVHEEHCALSWGNGQAIWRNSGDKAELRDADGALIDWFCYGDYEGQCE